MRDCQAGVAAKGPTSSHLGCTGATRCILKGPCAATSAAGHVPDQALNHAGVPGMSVGSLLADQGPGWQLLIAWSFAQLYRR